MILPIFLLLDPNKVKLVNINLNHNGKGKRKEVIPK